MSSLEEAKREHHKLSQLLSEQEYLVRHYESHMRWTQGTVDIIKDRLKVLDECIEDIESGCECWYTGIKIKKKIFGGHYG